MNSLTKDIFSFYNNDGKNDYYLTTYFTNTEHFGLHQPYAKNIFYSTSEDVLWGTVDEHTTYEINNWGLRGHIDENADVIATGCSITFGVGVSEETRWSNLLSKKINKNIINLGTPGASVDFICNNIIKYCLNVKMPKKVFCLMPDFFRSMVVVDKDFFNSNHLGTKKVRENIAKDDSLSLIYCNPSINMYNKSLFMEIKDKDSIEDSVSPHQLIFNAVNAIYILESFCSTNNIDLHWTTWDIPSKILMQKLLRIENFKLKKYKPILNGHGTVFTNCNNTDTLCSQSFELKNNPFWDRGSDYVVLNGKKDKDIGHPGIHFHVHIADFFYNLYNKDLSNI